MASGTLRLAVNLSQYVRLSLEAYERGELEHALMLTCSGLDGTGRNLRPRAGVRERFEAATAIERDSGEQVAQLRGRWTPDIYASKLDELARRYAAHAKGAYDTKVIVAVERNNHGHAVLLRLRELHADSAPYVIYRAKDGRQGWLTTAANRPLLVDQLEVSLRTGGLHLHDAATVDQLAAFAWSDDGRPEAPNGYHDDDVLALGIAWQVRPSAFARVIGLPPRG